MSWRAGIHGYAARWNVVTSPLSRPHAPHLSRPARFKPGCFVYDPARVAIWFMHREAQAIGTGDRLGLEMWEDDQGLAFAFRPPESAFSIVCGIADGRYAQCSVGVTLKSSSIEPDDAAGIEAVSSAIVREISICPRGACPGSICWHIGNGPSALSPAAQALLPGWQQGRARRPIFA